MSGAVAGARKMRLRRAGKGHRGGLWEAGWWRGSRRATGSSGGRWDAGEEEEEETTEAGGEKNSTWTTRTCARRIPSEIDRWERACPAVARYYVPPMYICLTAGMSWRARDVDDKGGACRAGAEPHGGCTRTCPLMLP